MAVKQTIPNTSQSAKSYTFGKFKGIDTSSSVFEVSPNRAVEMKNIINEDGVNHKRPGWESAPLENIVYYREFILYGYLQEIIYVKEENGLNYIGLQPYLDEILWCDTPIDRVSNVEYIGEHKYNGESSPCWLISFVYNYPKIVFTSSKEVISDTGETISVPALLILDFDEFVYSPRTTISITPDTNLTATRKSFENPNLFTDRRINSATNSEVRFIPITITSEFYIKQINLSGITYTYDSIDTKSVEIYVKEGQEIFVGNIKIIRGGVNAYGLLYEGETLLSGNSVVFSSNKEYKIVLDTNASQNYHETNSEGIQKRKYILDTKMDRNSLVKVNVTTYARFGTNYSYSTSDEQIGNTFNEYEFVNTQTGWLPYENKLYYKSLAGQYRSAGEIDFENGSITLFGDFPPLIEGQDNITIEFTTKDKMKNINIRRLSLIDDNVYFYENGEFFSERGNPFYIPSNNYVDLDGITGIMPLGDNSYCLFTSNDGLNYLNRTSVTIDGVEKYTYSLVKGQSNERYLGAPSPQTLANDKLFLSRNGLLALKYTSTIKSNDRITLERSGFINKELIGKIEKIISDAMVNPDASFVIDSAVHDNKFYLLLNDTLYVADARYKSSPRQQDMDDVFNYEWWVWKDVPIKKLITPNPIFIERSLKFISTDNKLCRFKSNTSNYTDDNNIKINAGELTYIASSDNLFQINMEIAPNIKDGTQIKKCKYKYRNPETNAPLTFFDSFEETYYVSDFDKYTGRFKLKDKTGEYVNASATFFDGYEVYYCNPRNIVSEWYTPVVDMGTSLYSKNLLTSTLVFEPNIEGEIKFGYLTRRKPVGSDKDSNLLPAKELDFNDLDFTDFSFSPGFAGSRTLRTKARNFNFIQFRIISDSPRDCALNNFTITYNIGRKNKGVR